MTLSKALFYFCISFIVGIALSSIIKIPQVFVWGFLIAGILMIMASLLIERFTFPKLPKNLIIGKSHFTIFGFCILFLILGVTRFQISEYNILNDKLSKFNDLPMLAGEPEKITLEGLIIDEPDIRDNSQKLKVRVDDLKSIILVTTNRYQKYRYLDKVKITGILKTPGVFAATEGGKSFDYTNYLAKDGIYSVMGFPKIELVANKYNHTILTFLYEKVLFTKAKLVDSISFNFSQPNNFILQGIIFGYDKNIAADLKEKFNATGLSHITAVSGSNIVILISSVMIFLLYLGFWRGQAFYFSVGFIWLYVILIGLSPSAVRAAIMGSIFLLSQKLGRQNTSARVIVMAATVMLFHNSMLLFYDIGFQLSFLASMGIIYLKPLMDFYITKIVPIKSSIHDAIGTKVKLAFMKACKFLLSIISVTMAVQIITLPIIVYNFGRISLIAPITNMLVLPIIPPLTIFGFLVSILGIFSNFLGWFFAIPSLVLLEYLIAILHIFSRPWATINMPSIAWIWILGYYLALFIMVKFLQKSQKPKFLGY